MMQQCARLSRPARPCRAPSRAVVTPLACLRCAVGRWKLLPTPGCSETGPAVALNGWQTTLLPAGMPHPISSGGSSSESTWPRQGATAARSRDVLQPVFLSANGGGDSNAPGGSSSSRSSSSNSGRRATAQQQQEGKPGSEQQQPDQQERGVEGQQEEEEKEYSPAVRAALAMLKFYRQGMSPLMQSTCRFAPTCSQYSIDSYKRYGVWKGTVLTAWRLMRCNPWGGSGYDPTSWPPVGLGPLFAWDYSAQVAVVAGAALFVRLGHALLFE